MAPRVCQAEQVGSTSALSHLLLSSDCQSASRPCCACDLSAFGFIGVCCCTCVCCVSPQASAQRLASLARPDFGWGVGRPANARHRGCLGMWHIKCGVWPTEGCLLTFMTPLLSLLLVVNSIGVPLGKPLAVQHGAAYCPHVWS